MLVKERLCHFLYKKETKKYYGAKLIFILFATFFGQIIFRLGAKKDFIYWIHVSLGPKWKNKGSGIPSNLKLSWLIGHSSIYCKLP
jgi:hypothetical protein